MICFQKNARRLASENYTRGEKMRPYVQYMWLGLTALNVISQNVNKTVQYITEEEKKTNPMCTVKILAWLSWAYSAVHTVNLEGI